MIAPPQHATAACVLADDGAAAADATGDGTALAALVAVLDGAGLAPIVAVVPAGAAAPAPARAVVAQARRRDATTSLRWGLTQLLNVPVTGALLVPAHVPVVASDVHAVLDRAWRGGAVLVLGGVADGAPGDALLWAHRDVWRDLLTATDGVAEVVRRYGAARA